MDDEMCCTNGSFSFGKDYIMYLGLDEYATSINYYKATQIITITIASYFSVDVQNEELLILFKEIEKVHNCPALWDSAPDIYKKFDAIVAKFSGINVPVENYILASLNKSD